MNPSCIAAIDMGSSKLRACVGTVEDGKLTVLSSCILPVGTEIRMGQVKNIHGLSKLLRESLDKLENDMENPCKIQRVYAAFNAFGLRSIEAHSINVLQGLEEVTQNILEDMLDDAVSKFVPESKKCEFCYLQRYKSDGYSGMNPLGESPKVLDAMYSLVVGNPELSGNLEEVARVAGIEDFRYSLGIEATAEAVLTEDEKRRGAAVIDFGAETTSLCVFKDNIVRYVCVLPFGGDSINHDLLQLNLLPEEAEECKLSSSAIHFSEWEKYFGESAPKLETLSKRDQEINEIVVARIEETVANIWAQLDRESVPMLGAGIVVTGGASQLKDLLTLLQTKTHMPVRQGNWNHLLTSDVPEEFQKPEYAQLTGLMLKSEGGGVMMVPKQQPAAEIGDNSPESLQRSIFGDGDTPVPAPGKKKEKSKTSRRFGWQSSVFDEDVKDEPKPEPKKKRKEDNGKGGLFETLFSAFDE